MKKLNWEEGITIEETLRWLKKLEMLKSKGAKLLHVKNLLISEIKKVLEEVEKQGFIIGKREGDAFKEYSWKSLITKIKNSSE